MSKVSVHSQKPEGGSAVYYDLSSLWTHTAQDIYGRSRPIDDDDDY